MESTNMVTGGGLGLQELGLRPSILDDGAIFPNSRGIARSIRELVGDGAEFEDKPPRPVNHFYDPVNGAALQFSSPHWALELPHPNEHPILGQKFSWREGRKYFLKALTEPARAERERNWGLTFETVGHVIHHIQDMAQPQHVRLDTHLSSNRLLKNPSGPRRWLSGMRCAKRAASNGRRTFARRATKQIARKAAPRPGLREKCPSASLRSSAS
jgi:hypothetical protein